MRKQLLLIILLVAPGLLLKGQNFSPANVYPIEASHSFVTFEVTYMGYAKVIGNFGSFYGSIYYNPNRVSQTSVTFQVDVESIDTNNDWRDKDLKSGNWFLEEEYPHIRFVSTSVAQAKGKLLVKGDLTIKETTKSIEFLIGTPQGVIKDIRGDDQVIFTGEYVLNRKEYGVMGKNWDQVKEGIAALSDDVKIEFSLLGKQMNEKNFSNFFRNEKAPHAKIYSAYGEGGLESASKKYDELKQEMEINANALNLVGYMLMKQDKYSDALVLMKKNREEFPDDSNTFDSLGEVYAGLGRLEESKANYEKSFALDPNNMNALEVLKHLE